MRDARREEIESDLWESAHDIGTTDGELALQLAARLLLGMPHDVAWRLAHVSMPTAIRAAQAAGAVCAFVSMAIGVAFWQVNTRLPPAPRPPVARRHVPPEPPPAPSPAGVPGTTVTDPVFRFARADYSVVTEGPPPARLKEVRPVYPPIALAAGLEGDVVVQASITELGRVTDASVEPAGILGRSAIDAVQRWEFSERGGPGTPARLIVRVSFTRSP
jgi:TonB family protein